MRTALLLSVLSALTVLRSGAQSTTTPTADSLIEAHYTGGFRAFAEHFYHNVNYPAAARNQCGIGHLHVRLTLQPGRGLRAIEFLNAFGYGMEEDVARVLKSSIGEWRGHGRSPEVYFSIGYQLEGGPAVEGDLTVVAYGVGGGTLRTGCPTSDELVDRVSGAVAAGRPKRGRRAYRELLRRGYRGEAWLALRAEHGYLYDDDFGGGG